MITLGVVAATTLIFPVHAQKDRQIRVEPPGEGREGGEDRGSLPGPCPSVPPGPPDYKLRDPGIPSGSLCRGACGADCDPDACTQQNLLVLCIPSPRGDKHRDCAYEVWKCGSHPCCVTHDLCFDACASLPVDEQDNCRDGCNVQCIEDEDCGAINCGRWALGWDPYTGYLWFTKLKFVFVKAGPCPSSLLSAYDHTWGSIKALYQ